MIYNHNRTTVMDWDCKAESLCPDCHSPLIARKGEFKCWHWAHRATGRQSCFHEESTWHLAMKYAYLGFTGWDIEVPIRIMSGGVEKTYRIDAMNTRTNACREFVHSLSPYYIDKHMTLKESGYGVMWIFDGYAFGSSGRRRLRDGRGMRHLLKPKAWDMHCNIGGLIHCGGKLYRLWKNDIWYPCEGDASRDIMENFKRSAIYFGADLEYLEKNDVPPPASPVKGVIHESYDDVDLSTVISHYESDGKGGIVPVFVE